MTSKYNKNVSTNKGLTKIEKDPWPEPSQGRQKGKAKERPKYVHAPGTKKMEEASPSHDRKLFHPQPF